jgi:hypothetical protein
MERGIVVQQGQTALCSKLWPHPGSAPQQCSDNLNVESTIDSLPFRDKFFMNHSLFVKKCDQHGLILAFCERNFWALVMTLRSIAWSFVSRSYRNTHDSSPFTVQSRKFEFLDKSGWRLGMMWVCVGRSLRWSSPSANLHGGFDESPPYWCLIHPASFRGPVDDLMSPFHGHLPFYLQFERLRDARGLDHPENPHSRL